MKFIRLYIRVLELLGREAGLGWTLALANLALASAMFVEPILFGRIVDTLANAQGRLATLSWADLMLLVGAWVGFGLFTIVTSTLVSLYADRLAHRQYQAVRTMFFEHVLQLPLSFYTGSHSGRLVKVMMSGTNTLWGLWLAFFREHFASLISLIVLLPLTLLINWRYGLLLIALCAVFAVLIAIVINKSEFDAKHGRALLHRSGRAHHGYAWEHRTRAELCPHRSGSPGHEEDGRGGAERPDPGAFVVGGNQRDYPDRNDADHAFHPHPRHLVLPARSHHRRRDRHVHELRDAPDHPTRPGCAFRQPHGDGRPRIAEFFDVLDTEPAVRDRPDAIDPGRVRGLVEFNDVSFSYDGKRAAVADLSFTALPGQTVALVGATGAGKSTALGLLHRAFDPQSGVVKIDGMDIRGLTLTGLRRNIGVVFQEVLLFSRSIAENLRVGKPDATDEELRAACERAQVLDVIERQPEGFDTNAGERGRIFSGGERQRLSIARALLKDPPFSSSTRRQALSTRSRKRGCSRRLLR